MIQLEAVFALLDRLRAEAIEMLEKPRGRDAFAFGEAHGTISTVAEMRDRLNDLVENNNKDSDDQ